MNKTTDKEQDCALQAAMQRRAAQVPPLADDFAERVMTKMNTRRQRARFYRLSAALTGIAAAVILAFLLWPESHETPIKQPVVTEMIEQNTPQSTSSESIIEEKKEAPKKPSEPAHKKHQPNKPHKAPQEPLLAQAEPATEAPARNHSEETASNSSNPYLIVTAQLQDLRSRGERLDREVAMMMHN